MNYNEKVLCYLSSVDKRLGMVIDKIGNLKIVKHHNGFRFLVGEIIEQMLSKKARISIESRLRKICNDNITVENILKLNLEDLRSIGLSKSKSCCIINLAKSLSNGELDLNSLTKMCDKEIISILTSYKGIGNWTAEMFLIFFLRRENILPYDDTAFKQAYKWLYETDDVSKAGIESKCNSWAPYCSIGARYLYVALDTGLTKMDVNILLKEYNS